MDRSAGKPAEVEVDVAVIGAGAVGLACAARLSRTQRSVIVLERNDRAGEETSARNSGVIHAGLYYEPGSWKARACVEGRERLYARCARDGVPHLRCGKLVVAQDDEERTRLEALYVRGVQNGAGALRLLDRADLHGLEPNVNALAALWSPETGIVDAAELVASYRREALGNGVELALRTRVAEITASSTGLRIATETQSGERTELSATWVVNAAGLDADRIAASAGLDIDALGYRLHPCKGDYFALAPALRGLVTHLVYPLPARAGLGIHVTLDLAGGLRAGPDTTYVDTLDYRVDPDKAALFGAAVRRYLPQVRDEDLQPDYAGIRPKLQAPNGPARDFVIEEATAHGVPGLVNLIGIESPGLTASEAIAEHVAAIVDR